MNLDPTVSPWIGIVASTGVCLWMAAIGLPLSRAVFGDRPRPVWPFYAPAIGIVVVLLTTNLSAYLIPGAPSAWFGLLVPSIFAAAVAWRGGAFDRTFRPSVIVVPALLAVATFVLAFSNRTQRPLIDEAWHFALARLLANGVFPPTTPYGPGAGIGYHYGHNLLAAVVINAAGVPAWTSLLVLVSFLVVVLILAAVGFAWELGAPLPLAVGIGATVGFFRGSVQAGLPPYVESAQSGSGLAGFLAGLAPAEPQLAFRWLDLPQQALAIVSPTSGRDVQMLSANILPVYADVLRFLHRDDLAVMGITHLHVTDRLEQALAPPARRLLDSPGHFRLLADRRSLSGHRHRVYEVLSGAGTRDIAPSSYRALREIVPADAPVVLLGRLSTYQRRMILFTFVDRDNLWRTDFVNLDRATRIPRTGLVRRSFPNASVVILADRMEPTALGLSRGDAVWAGDGMRAYDLTHAWSPVWRIPQDESAPSQQQRAGCELAADGPGELQLLGEPGSTVSAEGTLLRLTGTPQQFRISRSMCGQLALRGAGGVTPFAQARPYRSGHYPHLKPNVAGLGFDGGHDNGRAIINLWYRNPQGRSFVTGSELRMYEADQTGVAPLHLSPLSSTRWWPGPLVLAAETQMARIEFDGRRLEINGTAGLGETLELQPGRTYLLMLNIAGADPDSGFPDVLQQVPLVRVLVGEAGMSYELLNGILAIENRKPDAQMRELPGSGSISTDVDFTPVLPIGGSRLARL